MSYIEKEKLIKADIASIENRVRHAFNQGYDLGFKDGKEKAKPLESKPMVEIDLYSVIKQKYIEREVLDRIRAEIAYNIIEDDTSGNVPTKLRADWAAANKAHMLDMAIIDRYKAESEGKE